MSVIIVNGARIRITEHEKKDEIDEISGETQTIHTIKFWVRGKTSKELHDALLKQDILDVEIPESGEKFKARRRTSIHSYQNDLDEDTVVTFTVDLKVLKEGEDEEQKWDLFTGLFVTAISNWARTRALAKLLEDRGIITEKEYRETVKEIYDRDYDEMKDFILDGKRIEEDQDDKHAP